MTSNDSTHAAQAAELLVPVSAGELLDKIAILRIKEARLSSEAKLVNVRRELAALEREADRAIVRSSLGSLEADLRRVNEALWDIEEEIRGHEARALFDSRFVQLARSVYVTNDERARIKRVINEAVSSLFVEEKSYDESSR